MAVDLTAVVVAFGGSERLSATLDPLERAASGVPHETIVSAAADDPRALAESSRARVLAPDASWPNTPGAHRNQGAAAGTGAAILFADGDVVVEPEFVARG